MRSAVIWALTAATALLGACSSGGPHRSTTPSASPSLAPGRQPIAVHSPVGVAAVGHELWVVSAADGTVQQRNASTGQLVRAVPVGRTPLRVVATDTLVWVSVFGENRVKAIDRTTGIVVHDIDVPGEPEGLTVVGDGVWVVRQADEQVSAIGADGVLGRSVPVGAEPRLATTAGRYVVVSNFGAGTLTRVDTGTGTGVTSAHLCRGPQGIAFSAGSLWVACTTQDVVLRVDLDTLRIQATVTTPGEPDAVHPTAAGVQVTGTAGPTLYAISAAQRPAITRVRPVSDASALYDQANVDSATVGGVTWVTSFAEDTLWRVPA